MGVNPHVYVHVDEDHFGIKGIFFEDADSNVANPPATEVPVPNYRIGNQPPIPSLFDHSSELFQKSVAAVTASDDNLTYRIDGVPAKSITLTEINSSETTKCVFEQLLAHDPIYCEAMKARASARFVEQQQQSTSTIYHRYVEEDTVLPTSEISNANRFTLLDDIDKLGIYENEADAFHAFSESVQDPKAVILQRYLVHVSYSDDPTPEYKADITLVPGVYEEFANLQLCLPIVRSRR